ncbi:helix-turn-helix transcriptional regulator [Lentzea sp. NPDC092896]|uniref:helix-turn-helix transcriptional regulator n=1 Tax=Lentzea sp. NPDC092896 TaxID=3364127 RepID=UPI0038113B0E
MADDEWLLVPEVAKKMRVSARTVYRLVANRLLTAHRVGIGQGGIRVRDSAVDAFIKSREQAADTA